MPLLDRLTPYQVRSDPFPHIVVEDALDPALCDRLSREFPPMDLVTGGKRPVSTKKFYIHVARGFTDPQVSAIWRTALAEYVRPAVWTNVVRLFGDSLLREYPDFEQRFGSLNTLRTGVRRIDDFSSCEVLLDSKGVIHTPASHEPEIERLPHLKFFGTVFLAYLFLRPDEDRSEGAEFEFYSVKPGHRILLGARHTAAPENLNLELRVPYKKNTLVMFLNTPRSFQSVAARSASKFPYMALHFTGHLRSFLYDHEFLPGCGADATPPDLMYPVHRPTLGDRISYRLRRIVGRV